MGARAHGHGAADVWGWREMSLAVEGDRPLASLAVWGPLVTGLLGVDVGFE